MEVRVFFDGTGCPLSSNPWIGEVERERIGLFRGIGLYEGGRASNFKLCFQRKIKFLKPARIKESHLFCHLSASFIHGDFERRFIPV